MGAFLALVLVICIAAGIRIAYFQEQFRDPCFFHPGVDAEYYLYWARGLAFNDWHPPADRPDPAIRDRAFFKPPGYAWFLAAILPFGGDDLSADAVTFRCRAVFPRMVQVFIGLANLLLVFSIGNRVFGFSEGIAATLLCAVYPNLIFYELELLEPTLFVFFCLGFLFLLLLSAPPALSELSGLSASSTPSASCASLAQPTSSPSVASQVSSYTELPVGQLFVAGIFFALGCLVRPNLLACSPVIPVYFMFRFEGAQRWKPILAFFLAAALAFFPVTLRNALREPNFVLISANGGINFYLGNNPAADGYSPAAPDLDEWTSFDWPRLVASLSREVGHPITSAVAADMFTARAVAWISKNPMQAASLCLYKFFLFLGPQPVTNPGNREDAFEMARSDILRRLPVSFPLLLALALFGIRGIPSTARSSAYLLLAVLCSLFFSFLPFFVAERFRVTIVPILAIFSGFGLVQISKDVFSSKLRSIAFFVVLLGICSVNWTGYIPAASQGHFLRGLAWAHEGDVDQARACYEETLRLDPKHAQAAVNLGSLLLKKEDTIAASRMFEIALRSRPNWTPALYNLALVRRRQNRLEEALALISRASDLRDDQASVLRERGTLLCVMNRYPEAVSSLQKASSLSPKDSEIHHALGIALSASGNTKAAIPAFHAAHELNPDQPAILYNLARALDAESRLPEAIERYRSASLLASQDADIANNLAVALFKNGEIIAAQHEVARCRSLGGELHPDFLAALASSSTDTNAR